MATTTTTTTAGSPPTVTAVDVCPSLPLHDLTNARDCALRASSESKWAISGATEDKSAVRAVDQAGMIETTPTLMITAQEEEVQLPTPPLSASPSSTPPEGRWCRRCGATETGRWRTGPLGKGTLCNACGLNWKNKNYPTEGYNNSTYPPPPIEKKARSSAPCRQTKRTNVNSKEKQAHRARRPKSRRKTEDEETYSQAAACSLPSPPSQNDPLLPDNNHGVSEIPQDTSLPVLLTDRKHYLSAGMYSAFYKELKPKKAPKKQTIQFKLPLPIHHGEFLLKTQKDFELPPSILEEHERGDIKPSFIQVRENLFTGPKRRFPRQEAATCQCERPPKGQLGCGDDCLNRMLFYECDTMACACGDQCSNRRFQKKAYIEELETFQTAHRGWGLRTLVNIKRGELITEYCGEVISTDMCNQRMQTIYKNKKNFYFLEYAHGQVIDAGMKGSVARFINHSCDPNCHIEKWAFKHQLFVGVFASRDITAGEELFYDYNFATFGEGQDQACYCGSQKCRGTIGKKPPQKQG